MSAQERLTVLLSRARDAFIMIGNAYTFQNAKKGSEHWSKLFKILAQDGHIYDGFPVRCERHPDRTALVKCAADFDRECPDGGCTEPWYNRFYSMLVFADRYVSATILNCGVHACPSKCHQLSDHTKMLCNFTIVAKCAKGHRLTWPCHKGLTPIQCRQCEREQKQRERELAEQAKRDQEQEEHNRKMAELNAQIAQQQQSLQDGRVTEERKQAIEQKLKDLNEAVARANTTTPEPSSSSVPSSSRSVDHDSSDNTPDSNRKHEPSTPKTKPTPSKSGQRERWQRQKDVDGAINEHIDKIMDMTGLEDVKRQVLDIKAKVETSMRQGSSVQDERFNIAMLGNPGTGAVSL